MLFFWIKALHIIAVIAWMAGLLYLPRLFVNHVGLAPGSEASEMLNFSSGALPAHCLCLSFFLG